MQSMQGIAMASACTCRLGGSADRSCSCPSAGDPRRRGRLCAAAVAPGAEARASSAADAADCAAKAAHAGARSGVQAQP